MFMVRIDHLDLGEYFEFAKCSEAADSVIDKGSDAYVDAYVDWIQEEEDTPEDQRWPIPYCSEAEAQVFARSRDDMLTNLIRQNYGCEYCRRWDPQKSFPFPRCYFCGAEPSYHHRRCCPMRPSPIIEEDEESTNEGAEQEITTLWTIPRDRSHSNAADCSRAAFMVRKRDKKPIPPVSPRLKGRKFTDDEEHRGGSDKQVGNVILASCSALFFEESPYSECPEDKSFQELIGFDGTNTDVSFDLSEFKTKKAFEYSFKKHFSRLCKDR